MQRKMDNLLMMQRIKIQFCRQRTHQELCHLDSPSMLQPTAQSKAQISPKLTLQKSKL